jgi:hypothetical protein
MTKNFDYICKMIPVPFNGVQSTTAKYYNNRFLMFKEFYRWLVWQVHLK